MRMLLLGWTVLLAGCGAHYGAEDPAAMYGEADAARPILVERGKRLTLRMEANRGTGYWWSLATSGNGRLEPLGEVFYAVEKAVPGGGGAEYWSFRATGAGRVELRFEYRRPWEKDKPAVKTVTYTVEVR